MKKFQQTIEFYAVQYDGSQESINEMEALAGKDLTYCKPGRNPIYIDSYPCEHELYLGDWLTWYGSGVRVCKADDFKLLKLNEVPLSEFERNGTAIEIKK